MGSAAKRRAIAVTLVILAGVAGPSLLADPVRSPPEPNSRTGPNEPSEAAVRDILVQQSIDRYSGACACPYHQKFNEKLFRFPNSFRDHPTVRCGGDSEYIRPGGPTVFCYGSDVPLAMVEAYREHLRSTFLTEPQPQF